MKIPNPKDFTTAWDSVTTSKVQGERGFGYYKLQELGEIRLRLAEFSADFAMDHWCLKGHIVFCLAGEFEVELDGGSRLPVSAGSSFQIGEGGPAHRVFSKDGATVFIVD